MSVDSLQPMFLNNCLEDIENTLRVFFDSSKESYEAARNDISLEFETQSRYLRSREHTLIRELEMKYRQSLLKTERILELLELAKDCDAMERKCIMRRIQHHMHSKLETDRDQLLCSKFHFKCKKLSLEQNISRHGKIEHQVESLGFENELKSEILSPLNDNFSDCLALNAGALQNSRDCHHTRLQSVSSGKTDLESFEVLESPCLSNRSYGFSPSDNSEESTFPLSNPLPWLSERCPPSMDHGKDDRILPQLAADSKSWLSTKRADDECTLKAASFEDLETKMEVLLLKQGKDKLARDIESTALVRCQPVNGEQLCKRLGGCAFQLASDAMKMSTKPCVRSWLAQNSFPFEKPPTDLETNRLTPHAPEPCSVISQLCKVGESDSSMWLPSKCSCEVVSSKSTERTLMLGNNQRRDDNWKEQWLQKRWEPVVCDLRSIDTAKKSQLANLLLDSQGNVEADLEVIRYRPSFSTRPGNWLQSNCKMVSVPNALDITLAFGSNAQ